MKKIIFKSLLALVVSTSILTADILTMEEQAYLTKKMRSTLPQKLDSITSAVDFYIAKDKFIYTYEIKIINSPEQINVNKINTRMNNAMCTYPTLRNLINKGITLKYVYRNESTKKYLFSFEINKKVCEDNI
ncbi:MAG: hypothetical protein CL624_04510 [Arcobacter sp.]|nr:hypothetical protein [Arcobacter sp.]|tara:strand:- start:11968 stop:12363 length:396 start_codon:yes stop_codon:yes gene_type:complete